MFGKQKAVKNQTFTSEPEMYAWLLDRGLKPQYMSAIGTDGTQYMMLDSGGQCVAFATVYNTVPVQKEAWDW